jgi:hypothetical protein
MNTSVSSGGLADKSLIMFQNQAHQQLGIDPAFEEAGSGSSYAPANEE